MKTKLFKISILVVLGLIFIPCLSHAQVTPESIVGTWMPKDKKSHIIIYKQGDKYLGRLHPLSSGTFLDTKNPELGLQKRNLDGIVMLGNFVADGPGVWNSGTLYDPNSGKTYSCKISMEKTDELKVRGYVGLSMFGRTEIFTRVR